MSLTLPQVTCPVLRWWWIHELFFNLSVVYVHCCEGQHRLDAICQKWFDDKFFVLTSLGPSLHIAIWNSVPKETSYLLSKVHAHGSVFVSLCVLVYSINWNCFYLPASARQLFFHSARPYVYISIVIYIYVCISIYIYIYIYISRSINRKKNSPPTLSSAYN